MPDRNGTAGQQRLVAVVVTHDRLAQLQRTLARLLSADARTLAAVVVVDNASADGTAGWLARQDDPRICVWRNPVNGGGAAGFEAGLRCALARHDPDWIVVMDDDARPCPGALEAFHAMARDDGWDAVAAAVYAPDGTICEMNRPSRNPFWHWREFWQTLRLGRRGFHLRAAQYAGPPVAVDVASFVGLFLSRRAIALAGLPDRRLFLYGDDGLYTLGLRQAGGSIGFAPQIRFEHEMTTFAAGGRRFRPLWKVYYYHRNLLLLYRRAAGWAFWPVLAVILPRWLLRRQDHAGEEAMYDRLIRRAIRDGLRRDLSAPHGEILKMAARPSD